MTPRATNMAMAWREMPKYDANSMFDTRPFIFVCSAYLPRARKNRATPEAIPKLKK
jgi:hypothetical protein